MTEAARNYVGLIVALATLAVLSLPSMLFWVDMAAWFLFGVNPTGNSQSLSCSTCHGFG